MNSLSKYLLITLFIIISGLSNLYSSDFSDKISFFAEIKFAEKTKFIDIKDKINGRSENIGEVFKNDNLQIAYGMNIRISDKYFAEVSYFPSSMTYKEKNGNREDSFRIDNKIIHPVLFYSFKSNNTFSFFFGAGLKFNKSRLIFKSKRNGKLQHEEKSKEETLFTPTLNTKLQKILPKRVFNREIFLGASCTILLNNEQTLSISDEGYNPDEYEYNFENPLVSMGINLGFFL